MGYSPWDHKESDVTERLTHNTTIPILNIPKTQIKQASTEWVPL